jgi:hypothetical protein
VPALLRNGDHLHLTRCRPCLAGQRQALVFDSAGLISNVDKRSWKIKAIVAHEEREKVARRVRDNLWFLKREGYLLGVVPHGYVRVDGEIVEDAEGGCGLDGNITIRTGDDIIVAW